MGIGVAAASECEVQMARIQTLSRQKIIFSQYSDVRGWAIGNGVDVGMMNVMGVMGVMGVMIGLKRLHRLYRRVRCLTSRIRCSALPDN